MTNETTHLTEEGCGPVAYKMRDLIETTVDGNIGRWWCPLARRFWFYMPKVVKQKFVCTSVYTSVGVPFEEAIHD